MQKDAPFVCVATLCGVRERGLRGLKAGLEGSRPIIDPAAVLVMLREERSAERDQYFWQALLPKCVFDRERKEHGRRDARREMRKTSL